MIRSLLFHLSLILAFFASCVGCNKSKPEAQSSQPDSAPVIEAKTGIAVIDLNRIAIATGELERIQTAVKKKEQQMLGALQDLGRQHDDRISGARQAGVPGENENPNVAELESRKQKEMLSGAQTAQNQLVMHGERLRRSFHAQVRPIAQQIAQTHGCNVVLTAGQVFSMAPDIDITDKVISQLKSSVSATAISSGQKQDRYATLPGGGSFVPR